MTTKNYSLQLKHIIVLLFLGISSFASSSGAQISLLRPLEYEVIHHGQTSMRVLLKASAATTTAVRILNKENIALQTLMLTVPVGVSEHMIPLNQSVRNERRWLKLRVGQQDEVPFGLGLLLVVAGQSNTSNVHYCNSWNCLDTPSESVVALQDPAVTDTNLIQYPNGISSRLVKGSARFVPLSGTAPLTNGNAQSIWLKVGKALQAQYNRPVGFITLGYGGTSVGDWLNMLYHRLEYMDGSRPSLVLWHQGESDFFENTTIGLWGREHYKDRLQSLIQRSYEFSIAPWMVAETTVCWAKRAGDTYPQKVAYADARLVRTAQKQIQGAQLQQPVFAGPNTDMIPHECHFDSPEAFTALASAWINSLNTVIPSLLGMELPAQPQAPARLSQAIVMETYQIHLGRTPSWEELDFAQQRFSTEKDLANTLESSNEGFLRAASLRILRRAPFDWERLNYLEQLRLYYLKPDGTQGLSRYDIAQEFQNKCNNTFYECQDDVMRSGYLRDQLFFYYQDILGRTSAEIEADSAGFSYWLNALHNGLPMDYLREAFLNSSEGQVAELYFTILKRRPDHPGLMYWTTELSAGRISAEAIRNEFLKVCAAGLEPCQAK